MIIFWIPVKHQISFVIIRKRYIDSYQRETRHEEISSDSTTEFRQSSHVWRSNGYVLCLPGDSAAAIPCLAFCAERVRIDTQYKFRTHSIWVDLTEACGIFGSLIGFGAIFWHFSIPAAITFGIACFLANVLLVWYTDAIEKLNEEESQNRKEET